MADKRSDVSKISVCLLGLALTAAALGSGCAGVVMGSSSGSNSSPGSTPPPPKTPQPQVQQPQLAATPMTANFPGVAPGSTSSQTILLQNSGNASVTISSANITGAGFSTSGLTLPMSIAPGQNATFSVVFAPTSTGNVTGAISLVSDAPNSPLAISTSGSAVASAPVLNASTGNLNFGSVLVGSASSLGVVLTNTGNANAVISSVMATGAGFSVNGVSANTTVLPGQTVPLNVTFTPSATGSVTGGITVASNAGSVSIRLTGSGGQLSSHTVALNWDPSTSDVVGYFVYRMLPDGTYAKITNAPVVPTAFTDNTSLQSGQTYTYVVTAVDADNVESDFSDPAVAVIP